MRLWKKIAQYVAQTIFCQNKYLTFTVEKRSPKMWAGSVVGKKLPV
jgi:hypothetical protein